MYASCFKNAEYAEKSYLYLGYCRAGWNIILKQQNSSVDSNLLIFTVFFFLHYWYLKNKRSRRLCKNQPYVYRFLNILLYLLEIV